MYTPTQVKEVLEPAAFKQYEMAVVKEDVQKAGLIYLECPACDYRTAEEEPGPWFDCPSCQHSSCTRCKAPRHTGMECEAARRSSMQEAHCEEEKATEAVVCQVW